MTRSRVRTVLRHFLGDERGQAMVFVAIMLPALIGFSLLSVDMSRLNNLHNDLQKAADAFALAGAAELDGGTDAIARANRAISNLVSNDSRFSTDGLHTLTVDDIQVAFLSGIPASDTTPLSSAGVGGSPAVDYSTTNDALARYALVTISPTSFQTIFPAAMLGAPNTMSLSTQAVAGYGSAVCDYTPLFICNPYGSISAMEAALSGTSKPMILLKKQTGGTNAQYGPGNYGYLTDPSDSRQNRDIAEMLAVTTPRACYSDDGVQTKPGNIPALHDALNVRFDLFGNGNVAGYTLNPTVNPPAPNVRKGMRVSQQGNSCSYAAPTGATASNYMQLPRDNCFAQGTCAAAGQATNRIGDGAWNFNAYWTTNWPPNLGSNAAHRMAVEAECGASPSRFCVYSYEVAHVATMTSAGEATQPQCHTTTAGPERRLLYLAVIDCAANPVSGGGGTYPVQVFASVFLTEPAGGPPDADIYGELVDVSTIYGEGTLDKFQRNEAQLYR